VSGSISNIQVPPNNGILEGPELEALEIGLLLEGMYRCYGVDFREYALSSLRRRIRLAMAAEGLDSIAALQQKVLRDRACWRRLLLSMSVNVTSMFRDPQFFGSFRTDVVPMLRERSFIRIWHTGCATGQEVYSLAILLREEGLYDRCRIYATDINEGVLRVAKAGIYPLASMQGYSNNYIEASGTGSLSDYYTAKYGYAIFRSSLRENVHFSLHNLATDYAFNEFDIIFCRNVLIYFNKTLQSRVHRLLYASLVPSGVLALGHRESMRYTPHEADYSVMESTHRLYRKMAPEEREEVEELGLFVNGEGSPEGEL
jgi:chemotaxis protein methyltransferase CheR